MKKVDLKDGVNHLTQSLAKVSLSAPLTIDYPTVNVLEATSIRALIAYAANQNQMPESTIQAILMDEFEVDRLEHLHYQKYDAAVKMLVDFQAKLN